MKKFVASVVAPALALTTVVTFGFCAPAMESESPTTNNPGEQGKPRFEFFSVPSGQTNNSGLIIVPNGTNLTVVPSPNRKREVPNWQQPLIHPKIPPTFVESGR